MGRPTVIKNAMVIAFRIQSELYALMQEMAEIETVNTGKKITARQLIRDCVYFVYGDNERLRECFRRSRERSSRRIK